MLHHMCSDSSALTAVFQQQPDVRQDARASFGRWWCWFAFIMSCVHAIKHAVRSLHSCSQLHGLCLLRGCVRWLAPGLTRIVQLGAALCYTPGSDIMPTGQTECAVVVQGVDATGVTCMYVCSRDIHTYWASSCSGQWVGLRHPLLSTALRQLSFVCPAKIATAAAVRYAIGDC